MPAFIIAEITVTNPVEFETYRQKVPAVIAAHGGRYVVRGPERHALGGDIPPKARLVILEFPDMARLQTFWSSPEYAPLKSLRERSSTCRVEAVEGYMP